MKQAQRTWASTWQTDFKFAIIRGQDKLKVYDGERTVKKFFKKIPYLKKITKGLLRWQCYEQSQWENLLAKEFSKNLLTIEII